MENHGERDKKPQNVQISIGQISQPKCRGEDKKPAKGQIGSENSAQAKAKNPTEG